MSSGLREHAAAIFQAALQAADAGAAVRRTLSGGLPGPPLASYRKIFLLSVGKAALPMARACQEALGSQLSGQLVVTKRGSSAAPFPEWVRETSHPVPDDAGVAAAEEVGAALDQLGEGDLLLFALSGGASALLPAPIPELGLAGKQRITHHLLRAGADIHQLNTVRKHLSRLKGGQLASRAFPATVIALILSDVIGDPLGVIGSGPTAPDPSTVDDAAQILRAFGLAHDVHLLRETPKPGHLCFHSVHNILVGSNSLSLQAAAHQARQLGYGTLILSSSIQGEAREVSRVHAAILTELCRSDRPLPRPACVLSGGETTVTVRGEGKGGRNQEFALAAAADLQGLPDVLLASLGTDGSDGPTDAAGAFADGTTWERAHRLGLDPAQALHNNDSYPLLDAVGDLIRTGPTGTNVMDLQILLAG